MEKRERESFFFPFMTHRILHGIHLSAFPCSLFCLDAHRIVAFKQIQGFSKMLTYNLKIILIILSFMT